MSAINNVDAGISQTISNAGILAGNSDSASNELASATVDMVTLASKVGARKIVSTYETVSFSQLVPKPLTAKKLEDADYMAARIDDGRILHKNDEEELREDRIFAAIVGMRLMQQSDNEVSKKWIGGFDQPSDAELEAAYRRLTQRVSQPDEVDDAEYVHNMRVELVDFYKQYTENLGKLAESQESELESKAA